MTRQRTQLHVLMIWLYLVAPPFLFAQSNDHFVNRALLSGGSVSVIADNSSATTEPGEPINTNTMGKTLWWTWTAPTNGWVNVDIVPQPNDWDDELQAMLWRGNSLLQLTLLATVTNDSPRERPLNACMLSVPCRPPAPGQVHVQAGDTLQISVAAQRLGTNYRAGPFTLTLDLSTLELTSPTHDAVLAGPTNLVVRISAPNPAIEGNIQSLAFHRFWTNTGFGGVTYEGFREATNGLEATFGVNSSDYWFYARAVNEAGRVLTTPSHYVRVRPRNDHFHEATQITTLPFDDIYNLYNSTGEPNEPTLSNQVTSASVWWRWTAPSNCQAIVRAFAPIGIFSGEAIDSLLPHALGSNSVRASFQAGTTYFFKVASHSSSLRISQSFQLDPYPANDDFANRTVLAGSSLVQFADSTVATREPFEPPGGARSLWWSWTAPADGLLNIRSIVFRNVECSVWTGDSLTNLEHLASQAFQSYLPPVEWPPTLSYTILRLEVQQGQTYHLRFTTGENDFGFSLDLCTMQITNPPAGLFNGPTNMAIDVTAGRPDIEGTVNGMMVGIGPASIYGNPGSYATPLSGNGPFTGTITNFLPGVYSLTAWGTNSAGRFISTRSVPVHVAPWNDNFASARSISGWITNEQFWVSGSSTEDGEPEIHSETNSYSVWWKWTATANATVLIRSHGVPIAVFEGSSLASLQPIGSRLPYAVRLDAVAGTTYYIRAAAAELSLAPSWLNISPPLPNDDFANSILLSGDHVTFLVTNSHSSIEPGEPHHVDRYDGLRGSLWWHWIAETNGLLFIESSGSSQTFVEALSGTELPNLIRQVALDDPALEFVTAYRVRANERLNFAFDTTYGWTNRTFRLRFFPDPPVNQLQLVRLADNRAFFMSQANIGEEIILEASRDLENWDVVDMESVTEPVVYLSYTYFAVGDHMFFRAVRRPPSAR